MLAYPVPSEGESPADQAHALCCGRVQTPSPAALKAHSGHAACVLATKRSRTSHSGTHLPGAVICISLDHFCSAQGPHNTPKRAHNTPKSGRGKEEQLHGPFFLAHHSTVRYGRPPDRLASCKNACSKPGREPLLKVGRASGACRTSSRACSQSSCTHASFHGSSTADCTIAHACLSPRPPL